IIYENRPNVTSDAAGLCVKAGNAVLLRGSSSALRSNIAVASVLRDALAKHGLPEDAVILVEDTTYEAATQVMQLTDYVDCLIPRGGPSLIQSIRDNAKVPVIIDGDGNCHVYVDASADLDEALTVVVNARTRFTDGEEFGFGAEIGISTQKLHARGPMGLRELTTYKYVIWGEGQVRT